MKMSLCLLGVALLLALNPCLAPDPGKLLKAADRAYAEKSYKKALKLYHAARKLKPSERQADHMDLRMGLCLGHLNRQDEGLNMLRNLARKRAGKLVGARAYLEAGVLSLAMPHYYCAKDGKKFRGRWVQGGVYHWTQDEDLRRGLLSLESAGRILERLVKAGGATGKSLVTGRRLHQRCFLEWAGAIERVRGRWGDRVPPGQVVAGWAYGELKRWNARMAWVFDRALAVQKAAGKRSREVLVGYLKGLAFGRLLRQLGGVHRGPSGRIFWRPGGQPQARPVELPRDWNPLRILQATRLRAKGLALADDVTYALGAWQQDQGLLVEAEATFKGLLTAFPHSPWRADGRSRLEQITFPRLKMKSPVTVLAGERVKLTLRTANVKEVELVVRAFPPAWLFQNRRVLADPDKDLSNVQAILKHLHALPGAEAVVLSLRHQTPDAGRHQSHEELLDLGPLDPGAYLVEARAGKLLFRELLLVSRLCLVRHVADEGVLVFVTDAHTGEPVPGAQVLVRERRWVKRLFGGWGYVMRLKRGTTDVEGLFRASRSFGKKGGYEQIQIGAFKGAAGALTPEFSYSWPGVESASRYKAYIMSDRTVYRPGDTIRLAAILRQEEEQGYRVLADARILLRVRDPKGTVVFERELETDPSGALDQALELGRGVPLGRYQVEVQSGKRLVGSNWFRMEEYRKPEFEVQVQPGSGSRKLGSRVSAVISGRYYFGAPVAGGQVTYRVLREVFQPRFRGSEPFRYLYGSLASGVDPSDRGLGRELVLKGEGHLDAQGKLEISWDSAPWNTPKTPRDSLFIVQAEVSDASRREITGLGRFPVTRHAFQTRLVADRGFYEVGERVQVEIETQTSGGKALATSGKLRIYRREVVQENGKQRESLTQILEEEATTSKLGVGFVHWTADAAGRFLLSYQALDAWGELVRADMPLWVQGAGFRAGEFQLKNVRIRSQKRVYKPGETARLLVTSNFENAHVLLLQVAGSHTLDARLVALSGKVAKVDLPVVEAMLPNVFVVALCVRHGHLFSASRELLVPPQKRLLQVDLSLNKASYLPGERGQAHIKVRDSAGQPVAARVALAVFDASLLYLQAEHLPDVRKFFYGHRRGRGAGSGSSLAFAFRGYLAEDVVWGHEKLRGHPIFWWGVQPGQISRLLAGHVFGRLESLASLTRAIFSKKGLAEEGRSSGGVRSLSQRSRTGDKGFVSSDDMAAGLAAPHSPPPASQTITPAADQGSIRTDFRDTACFDPDILCNAQGEADIPIPFPESLTRWQARAVAWTADTRVGQGEAGAVTAKPVMVRLVAPRFFQEGDRLLLSVLADNRTGSPQKARVSLEVAGGGLTLAHPAPRELEIPAQGQRRLDWWARVVRPGEATLTARIATPAGSDAMRKTFPVKVWGASKVLVASGFYKDSGAGFLDFKLPTQRRVATTRLEVTVEPSLAALLLDALPYLIAYPYGCTEQTMSRFVPAVMAALTLKEMGLSLSDLRGMRPSIPGASRHGMRPAVFSQKTLDEVVQAGLLRMDGMQNPNGGFGWWKHDASSPYLSAYVLLGLELARKAGYRVSSGVAKRLQGYLEEGLASLENLNTAVYVARALGAAGHPQKDLLKRIYPLRDQLSPMGRALLACALHAAGQKHEASIVVDNLEDSVLEDREHGTAHWEGGSARWWWWNSSIETNAAVLEAFLDVRPTHPLVRPLVKWLVMNRRGNRWHNSRDTAAAVLALLRFARSAGELDPDYSLTLKLGSVVKSMKITKYNLFSFQNRFVLQGDALSTGHNRLEIQQEGRGAAYVTARLGFFTREEEIKGAGHQVAIRRRYFRIEQVTELKQRQGRQLSVLGERRVPLQQGALLPAGAIVEVELEVQTQNDYEYLFFEDMKPAGFEPLKLHSGLAYARGISSHVEFRKDRTAFFVTWLQQGRHTLRYRLRAEIPGVLRALPARGGCLYSAPFRGISDSFRLQVREQQRQ